jgi:alpha-beta hydrolase superfamily lysophospholipase
VRRQWAIAVWLVAATALGAAEPAPGAYRRRIRTEDGTQLAVYRFVPAGGGLSRPPVVMLPELGFNRLAYDLDGGGLARFLQGQGFDVFVVEPRGHGASDAPQQWRLTDLALKDARAALEAISSLREGPADLVVQGYSGAVVLGALAQELKGKVRRVIALAPAVAPDPPSNAMRALLALQGRWPQLGFSPEGARLFDLLFAHTKRLVPGRAGALRSGGLCQLPASVSAELQAWMESGELLFPDGKTLTARLAGYDRVTFLVLGLADNFSQPDFGSPLRDVSDAPIVIRLLNRRDGVGEDYAHLSLLHGLWAPGDIFGPAARFLLGPDPERRRGAAAPDAGVAP